MLLKYIFLIICLSLAFLLCFFYYKYIKTEHFEADDDIVPDEGNGFATVHQKEEDRKKEVNNKVGGANDWGGVPSTENGPQDDVIYQGQLLNCKQQIDEQNTNYEVYLQKYASKAKMDAMSRKVELEKNALDIQEQINLFKVQIKDNNKKVIAAQVEIEKENQLIDQCNRQVKPLDDTIAKAKACCDGQRAIADDLSKQFDSCLNETNLFPKKIEDAQNSLNDLKNQLDHLKNINSTLRKRLNSCQED